MARKQWTTKENQAIIRLYFEMLDNAIIGNKYNKAAMIREVTTYRQNERYYGLCKPLADRSRGSIEAKLMNCSAAHRDILTGCAMPVALQTMHDFGYRALNNYQAKLKGTFYDALRIRWHNESIDQAVA